MKRKIAIGVVITVAAATVVFGVWLTERESDDDEMLIPIFDTPRRPQNVAATFRIIEQVGVSSANLGAHQGVATVDGNTFWVSAGDPDVIEPNNSYLYKYTRNGSDYSLVASRGTSGDWPSGMAQINSIHYHNGRLYVGGNNYNTTPRLGWILEYDPDDLTLITSHETQGHWSEGGAWRKGEFWVCYANAISAGVYKVSRYDSSFNHIADYELPVDYTVGTLFHEGLIWDGDILYSMIHAGTEPLLAEVFHWDDAAEEFSLIQRLRPPSDDCTQGIALDQNGRMWWAERGPHRVVQSVVHRIKVPRGLPKIRAGSSQAANLLAWWPLNDGAGLTATEVANGVQGTLTGGAAWVDSPCRGPTVSFDGDDDMIEIDEALLGDALTEFTVVGWFRSNGFAATQLLVSQNAVGSNAGDWQLNFGNGVTHDVVRFMYDNGTNLDSTNTVRPGEWVHVAAALGSDGAVLYVNGEVWASNSTPGAVGGNGQNIRIGLQSNDSGDFNGSAHDVRFYAVKLDGAVIAAMAHPATMFQLWR